MKPNFLRGNIHRLFLFLIFFTACKKDASCQSKVNYYKVWDRAAHNAFTDLAIYQNSFYLVFREASGHASNDGSILIMKSSDGRNFRPIARIADPEFDLRDPKLQNLGDSILYLQYAMVNREKKIVRNGIQLSQSGASWQPRKVFTQDDAWWLWGLTEMDGTLVSLGYNAHNDDYNTIYTTKKPGEFVPVAKLKTGSLTSTEASLASNNDTVFCAIRATHGHIPSYVGYALKKNLADWKCVGQNTELILGGPKLFFLPNGKLYLVTRSSRAGQLQTCLYNVDRKTFKLSYILTLPSKGDNSYGGVAVTKTDLFVSYYSTDNSKTAIFVAKIPLSEFK